MQNSKGNIDIKILIRYLEGNGSDEDTNMVRQWFTNAGSEHELYKKSLQFWDGISLEPNIKGYSETNILDHIHHKIKIEEGVFLNKTKPKIRFISYLTRIAAILFIPVLVSSLFFCLKFYSARFLQVSSDQAYNEVFSSVDAITKVSLPDGSYVWLNHNSSLRYPAVFSGKYRKVELKGEGYFEVFHNSKLPFMVNAGEIQVLALGTTFNIMAYPYEDKVETSLINGSVELRKLSPDGKTTTLCKMNPTNYSIYYKGNNEILTKTISDDRYFSWKDGNLIFTSEPMEEVVKKLSRWFNVDIQIKDPELNDLTLTATFVHETLPQVMELLTLVSPIKFSISNRVKIKDGTFSKGKVIISKQ